MTMSQTQPDFAAVISAHQDKIYRICRAYLYDTSQAQDLYQEVLINLWQSLPRFKGQSAITTWIYRVTVNTTMTYNRQQSRYQKVMSQYQQEELGASKAVAEQAGQKDEQIDQLYKAINQLKADEKLLISLVLEDLSYKEIAEVIGLKPNHVGVKINRVKQKIATLLK